MADMSIKERQVMMDENELDRMKMIGYRTIMSQKMTSAVTIA